MNLGEYIEELKKRDPNKVCQVSLMRPHSWRGIYAELAFSIRHEPHTVGQMLEAALSANGKTFEGYKGGEYAMSLRTSIHLEEGPGYYSDGGAAAELIKSLDGSVDVEGRTPEWLYSKAIQLVFGVAPPKNPPTAHLLQQRT